MKVKMKQVVITGIGAVTPVGNDLNESWNGILEGRTGVDRITLFDPGDSPVKIAAEVKGFEPKLVMNQKQIRQSTRFVQLALAGAQQAIMDSGLDTEMTSDRFGCVVGVGLGALNDIEENSYLLRDYGVKKISPYFIPMAIPNMAAGYISQRFNLRGPSCCIATACASGTHAVGEAFRYIQNNMADVMVCGGAESVISPLGIASFAVMKALSRRNDDPQRASRPFDRDRDGFILGEGSGILILEELEHAKNRGAKIYARVAGYGLSSDAYHITAPAPDAEGGKRSMKMALDDAGIDPIDIDYINAHGTSTKLNDQYESTAIANLFGAHTKNLAISSTKGSTGHCIGAAGGIEAALCACAIQHSVIPPTINYQTPDPDCPLNYTPNEPRQRKIRFALSNSFGFGGANATIIVQRFEN